MATNVEESSSSTFDTEDKHGSELVQQVDDSNLPLQENSVLDVTAQKTEDESGSELNCLRVEEPDVKGSESEVAGLRAEMERLQQELKGCVGELQKVQKQLSQSERLQQITERYNQDLRQQVEKLSMEIHEQKKKKKNMVEAETQTEEYTWTETDYYNYYYGGYHQPVAENTAEVVQNVSMATQETSEVTEMYPMATESATVHPELPGEESEINSSEGCVQQVGDGGSSIADMLKATAEEALTQTSFVFDESSGMYYDHATGFYYDSSNQLYYDASTGMYYYYDPDSGKYQFHSRIELPAVQLPAQDDQTSYIQEKIVRKKCKKNSDKTTHVDNGDQGGKVDESKIIKRQGEHVEDVKLEKSARRKEHRACSKKQCHDEARGNRTRSASRRKGKSQKRSRSRSKEKHKKKKKKKKKKSRECTEKRSRSDNTSESEPEEGEITGSEKEKEHSTSSSSSSSPLTASPPSSPTPDSPGIEMQTQEEAWPPCVRVTVVRSPILEPGTLFILTADSLATIGREKDMNHAIRIPEIGVSKSHAEVYFDQDQQCYMLVDQGSQNGTVINGSRILQPKVRCDPCPLTHGDEVKVGETVLSFHIHSGTNTCDGCEPGQVRAHLNRHPRKKEAGCTLSKEDKELLRQRELKQMKLKYGLETSDYEDSSVLKNSKYKDRAESRRHKVGSEGTFHRDDAPASLHVEISEVNKGRQMLEKMGWKSGEGLGRDGAGITEPIGLQVRPAQSGLGSSTALSVEDASVCRSRNQQNWERARERFLHTQTPTSTPKAQPAWVKGQPQSDP